MKRLCTQCKWWDGDEQHPLCNYPGEPNGNVGVPTKDYTSCKVNREWRFPGEIACGKSGRWWEPR